MLLCATVLNLVWIIAGTATEYVAIVGVAVVAHFFGMAAGFALTIQRLEVEWVVRAEVVLFPIGVLAIVPVGTFLETCCCCIYVCWVWVFRIFRSNSVNCNCPLSP